MKRRPRLLKNLLTIGIAALALYQLAGCSGTGGGSSAASATGVLKLSITDKPSDNYSSVVVTVSEVRAVPAGRENAADNDPALPVIARFSTPKAIDVMQLQFIQQALGEVTLPAGSYSQIRLVLAPNPNGQGQAPVNYLTLKSAPTTAIALKSPSGQQSGLKILGPLQVKPGVVNAVAIDFDPNTAIVQEGNGSYLLKPTGIRLIQLASDLTQYGTIGGTVSATFKDWSSATVTIKRRGAINDTDPIAAGRVFSTYTSGKWQAPFTAFVPPSSQTISYKAFVSANGFRLYSSPALPVAQGQLTDLNEISLTPAP